MTGLSDERIEEIIEEAWATESIDNLLADENAYIKSAIKQALDEISRLKQKEVVKVDDAIEVVQQLLKDQTDEISRLKQEVDEAKETIKGYEELQEEDFNKCEDALVRAEDAEQKVTALMEQEQD